MTLTTQQNPSQNVQEEMTVPISQERVRNAKRAYTTRRADLTLSRYLLSGERVPVAGDLVLARVEKIGQHQRIELPTGRRSRLYVGDEIIVCFGARYAPDQFESCVPEDLGACDLVAAGGIASSMISKHARMKDPTRLVPIGILADDTGERMNIHRWGLTGTTSSEPLPQIIAAIGTSMNAGKTSCAKQIVHGLRKRGLKVGATKVTGTGAGGDRWVLSDAGADIVLDFTDAGVASTFGLNNQEIINIFKTLTQHLADQKVDVIVLEVADGLLHGETAELLQSPEFRSACDGIVFAAGDAMGSAGGVKTLRDWGLNVVAVSGFLTSSALAMREAEILLDVPVIHTNDLAITDFKELFEKSQSPRDGNTLGAGKNIRQRRGVSAGILNGEAQPTDALLSGNTAP